MKTAIKTIPLTTSTKVAQEPDPRRYGFTLLEISVVMLLVALIVGTMVVSLRGPLERVRIRAAIDRIEALDHRARISAVSTDQTVFLELNIDQGRFVARSGHHIQNPEVLLADGLKIDVVRTVGVNAVKDDLRLVISPAGQSETYAVRLSGPGGEYLWAVFAGGTGRCERYKIDAKVDRLFEFLRSARGLHTR